jgi:hypothetical protein
LAGGEAIPAASGVCSDTIFREWTLYGCMSVKWALSPPDIASDYRYVGSSNVNCLAFERRAHYLASNVRCMGEICNSRQGYKR